MKLEERVNERRRNATKRRDLLRRRKRQMEKLDEEGNELQQEVETLRKEE